MRTMLIEMDRGVFVWFAKKQSGHKQATLISEGLIELICGWRRIHAEKKRELGGESFLNLLALSLFLSLMIKSINNLINSIGIVVALEVLTKKKIIMRWRERIFHPKNDESKPTSYYKFVIIFFW